MGVSCVYSYPVPEGRSGSQIVDHLQRQVETLGATKAGKFLVDCETYQSVMLNTPKTLHILHTSEHPASCFAILDSGITLVADTLFNGLMSNLKSYYQARKGAKIESRGQRFHLCDFVLKIGSVSQAGSMKGVLVEVEYCPSVIPAECWGLLKELLSSLIGSVADKPPAPLASRMEEPFSAGLTMLQYLDYFNTFRSQAAMSQNAGLPR